LWSVKDVITKGQKHRRTGDRSSWKKSSCVICGAEDVKRHGIGETERQNAEEQKE